MTLSFYDLEENLENFIYEMRKCWEKKHFHNCVIVSTFIKKINMKICDFGKLKTKTECFGSKTLRYL